MTAPFTSGLSFFVWSFLLRSFHLWSKAMSSTCYNFLPLFFSLVQSSFIKVDVYFRNFCYTTTTQVSSLWRSKIVTCEKCGTQTRIGIFRRRRRRCLTQTLHFTHFPSISTTSQTYLSLILYFSQITVEIWLHFSLTTV